MSAVVFCSCCPVLCASFIFLTGSCFVCLALLGPSLGISLMRLVGVTWFKSASSSMCRFRFSFIIRPALFCVFVIRLCPPGIVPPWMMSHISDMLMLSGFSGHVHVGHVYGFSRMRRCIIK